MQAPKNITVIPATINPVTRLPKESKQLRRVAAYARVSTDSEEQLTSYAAQVDYYTPTDYGEQKHRRCNRCCNLNGSCSLPG